ncbi:flagellar hook protein FlgE [Georgenia ruanii]|uniref:Flagellar hook protein FlgE n=1 Tax=Georgenia ruanii TaxID=348442 RepID=A0A7J9UYK9_9MICO|nr:flagellar hook protein FlgE [Georgenia ruanii]MPV89719.1 flagellar hook-basal body complex protein [Georgenia ruanii]
MLRSLFSGISSLRSHQTMLDVTGNNIANVNTTGYKAARTQFEDTLSQVLQNAGAPQAGQGGTNPAQVGLGVQVAAITNNFTDGATQQTGSPLDMKITGDGFFIINSGTEQLYTRAGAFTLDALGQLTTPGGALVQGWGVDANGKVDPTKFGNISLPVSTTMGARATAEAVFEGNLPAEVAGGTTIDRTIQIYNELGVARDLKVTFAKQADGSWKVNAGDGAATAVELTLTPVPAVKADPNATPPVEAVPAGTFDMSPVAPWKVGGVTIDLSRVSGFGNLSTLEAKSQDGMGAGTLQSFSMNADGTLIGSFSNGFKEPVGRIALANFANAAGLEKAGGTAFRSTVNSGEAQVGTAGTGGRGSLSSRALEMSNVDLSQEFTNLIIAQRGFQAGSRVITTSDELLQELVNLKR